MVNRITPANITSLKENEVFVFGSNQDGRHGAGAAKLALTNFGAIYGQPRGIQGQSYAIVTKKLYWKERSSTLEEIKYEVDLFIEYAKLSPDLVFLVTTIGCALAGYVPEEIGPLFHEAVKIKNIKLPVEFWDVLNN